MDIKQFITNMRLVKIFMKYIVSKRELKLMKIFCQKKIIKEKEEEDTSGFESCDYFDFIETLKRDQGQLNSKEIQLISNLKVFDTTSCN